MFTMLLRPGCDQDPEGVKIQIYKIEQVKEGMGHVIEEKDHLLDGNYNFNLFKALICKKKSNVPNYKFEPEENVR
jgi:hypothetical protein